MNIRFPFALLSLSLLAACHEYEPYPRKRAYARIDIPATTAYTQFESKACPFTFAYPAGGVITRQSEDSCWADVNFPQYDCKWHITYRNIKSTKKPASYHFEQYRDLVYKHSKKATQIQAMNAAIPAGKMTLYEIYGNVGTPAQYFLLDTTETHNIMLSFYFQTALRNDSLAPVIAYMKAESRKAMESLRWK